MWKLWTKKAGFRPIRAFEILCEGIPQFLLQIYIIIMLGFGFNAQNEGGGGLAPQFTFSIEALGKLFGVTTSFITILYGVNEYIVTRNFSMDDWTRQSILKCGIYTIPSILSSLLFFPVCYVFIGSFTLLINVFLTATYAVIYFNVNKNQQVFNIQHILPINIAPQAASLFKDGSSYKPGELWILGKAISNTIFLSVSLSFHYSLELMPMNNSFINTKRITEPFVINW